MRKGFLFVALGLLGELSMQFHAEGLFAVIYQARPWLFYYSSSSFPQAFLPLLWGTDLEASDFCFSPSLALGSGGSYKLELCRLLRVQYANYG